MDLDQAIVRSSFQHLGIPPRFDDPRVQWWFGDCTKSLALLPPDEYFGSFDLVVIDLLNFIFDALEVNGIRLVDYLMKMVKPDGILVRQEDFVTRSGVDFAKYTVDLDIVDMPHVVEQYFGMGSNTIDFTKQERVDHGIGQNLYYHPLQRNHSVIWHGYRTNDGVESEYNVDKVPDTSAGNDENRLGVLIVIEAENVDLPLDNMEVLQSKIESALEASGVKGLAMEISETEKDDYNTLMFSFDEGYVAIRSWTEHSYCAIDLQLWNSIHKEKIIVESFMQALGTSWETTSTSSYRITTGGMFGTAFPKASKTLLSNSTSESDGGKSEQNLSENKILPQRIPGVVKDMTKLIFKNVATPLILVLCPGETEECQSYDALVSKSSQARVISIKSCSGLTSSAESMATCEYHVRQLLRDSLSGDQKIDGIIIDQSTPKEMGQILYRIFSNKLIRSNIVGEYFTMLAPFEYPAQSPWRNSLMDRFRSDLYFFNPVFHASVRFGNDLGFEIFSIGEPDFYAHLNEVMAGVRETYGLDSELLRSRIGLKSHDPRLETQFSFI